MKVAIIADTHFGVRNDKVEFLDYQKRFFDNVFFPTLTERQITTVIHLGDLTDRRKYLNYYTGSRMMEDFLDPLRNFDVHIICGNHDVFYRDTNCLSTYHLSVFNHYPKFNVYLNPTEVVLGGHKLLFVPWINKSNEAQTFELIRQTDADLCFGHLELAGYELSNGVVAEHGYDGNAFAKFFATFSGHYHHKSHRNGVHYLGAPYQMTWADHDCPRGFHLLDLKSRELEFIENPYHMFTKIEYDDTDCKLVSDIVTESQLAQVSGSFVRLGVIRKNNPYLYDQVRDAIDQAMPLDVRVSQLKQFRFTDNVEEQVDVGEDTVTIVNKSIDMLDLTVNKNKLKILFSELYKQAQSMEI